MPPFSLSLLLNHHMPYIASVFSPKKGTSASGGAFVRPKEEQGQEWLLGSLLGITAGRWGGGGGRGQPLQEPLHAYPALLGDISWFSTQQCKKRLPANWPTLPHILMTFHGSHCSPTHSLSSHLAPSSLRALALHTHSVQPSTCPRTCSLSQAALTLRGAPGPGVPLHAWEFAHMCAVLSCHCQVHSAQDRPTPELLPSKYWSLRSTG